MDSCTEKKKRGIEFFYHVSIASRCKMENVREIFFDEEKEYFGCL